MHSVTYDDDEHFIKIWCVAGMSEEREKKYMILIDNVK